MTRPLTWTIEGNDRLSDLMERLDATLTKVGKKLDQVGVDARDMGRQLDDAERKTRQFADAADEVADAASAAGNDLKKMAADAGFLDKRIAELRRSTQALAAEFARTGDKDIFKQLQAGKRELGQMEKISKELFKAGIELGAEVGKGFLKSLADLGSSIQQALPAEIKVAVFAGAAALGVALSPLIASTVSAAVLGGVGAGGIIGGLVLASKDSRVQAAGAALGERAMSAFSKSASVFVQPVLHAMTVLDAAVDDVAGQMRDAFAEVAPALVPLARGLTGMVKEMMPGLTSAMRAARPVLMAIGAELPKIGRALSSFLTSISRDPRGAIMAFQDLSRIIQVTIVATGKLLGALSSLWAKISPMIRILQGDAAGAVADIGAMEAAIASAKAAADKATGGFGGLGDGIAEAEQKMRDLQSAMDRFFGRTMGVREATRQYEQALDDLTDSVRENGKTLDVTTQKGRDNGAAIDGAINKIKDLRQANIDNKMSVEDANAIYDKQLEQLRKTLLSLGFNKDAVNALIDSVKAIPTMAELEFKYPGLDALLRKLRELVKLTGGSAAAARALGDGEGTFRQGGSSYGNEPGRAAGGPVWPGQVYRWQEQGSEWLVLGGGSGRVVSNQDVRAAQSRGAASGDVVGTLRVIHETPSGTVIREELLALKRQRGFAQLGLT